MKKIVFLSLFLLPASLLAAEPWSLDSCINHAVTHSISVRQAMIERQNADYSVTEAKDRFLPELNAQAGQSFNFGRGLTSENTYAQRNTSNFQWGVSMNMPLFQGLSAVRQLKYSKLNLQAVLSQVEEVKDNVTLNVISSYLQALYNKELLETANRQVELSQYELERQRILAEAGKIAEVDVLQATAQLAQDKQSQVEAENNVAQSLLDLSQLLQLPSSTDFDIQPLGSGLSPLPSVEQVCSNALFSYSSVIRRKKEIESAKANEDVARSGYIPRLSMNAGIGSSYYNISGMENPTFSRQMRDNLNKYIGFTLSIPIFDGFSTRNSLRKAKLQTTLANLQLEDTQTSLVKAINQAHLQAQSALSRYEAAKVSENANEISFEAMKEKYNMGRSNPYEFEQAKNAYLKSTISRLQAQYEYQLRLRILNFYNGD